MKTIKTITIILILLLVFSQAPAQEFAPVGSAVAQFLEIGVGARASAMGEAYTALTNDAASAFWNPSGLALVEKRNVHFAYNSWPADISIGGLSLAMNIEGIGTFGLNAIYLNTDDMAVTTLEDPEGSSGQTFSISNYAVGLSYARFMTERLSVGITAKIVSEKYYGYGYTTFALDLGTLYRTGFRGLNIGMSILHFGPEVRFDGDYIDYSDPKSVDLNRPKSFETYSLPINFRVGISIDVIEDPDNHLIAAVDMVHPNNNLEQYNTGFEYGFQNLFFLRGGYKFNTDEAGLTLGLGVKYELLENYGMQLDYAYSDMGVLMDVHRVSFGVTF
jgi:opacity protein-like surface antigen